jgi:Putative addiction module component
MAQMTPEVSKLLEQALSLSLEEQEVLADSSISNLGGKVDEGLHAAWEAEIGKRVAELDSGEAKAVSWGEVRRRNLAKLNRVIQDLFLSDFLDELSLEELSFEELSLLELSLFELSLFDPSLLDPSLPDPSFEELSDLDFSSFLDSLLPPSEDAEEPDFLA